MGEDIDDEATGDESAASVDMSVHRKRVIIGSRFNDGNGSNNVGHAKVYEY